MSLVSVGTLRLNHKDGWLVSLDAACAVEEVVADLRSQRRYPDRDCFDNRVNGGAVVAKPKEPGLGNGANAPAPKQAAARYSTSSTSFRRGIGAFAYE